VLHKIADTDSNSCAAGCSEVEQSQDVTNPERPTVTDGILSVDANNYAKHET
jgi:hypothetical protein